MANALVSIQIIPKTPGGSDVIPFVDAAIAVIDAAGVPYRVAPLETTMEGELSQLLAVVEDMHAKLIEMGSASIISQVKIYHNPAGASMRELTKQYGG